MSFDLLKDAVMCPVCAAIVIVACWDVHTQWHDTTRTAVWVGGSPPVFTRPSSLPADTSATQK